MTTTRLLIVSNFFPPVTVGGAEIVAHRQALALQKRGWAVEVFAGGYASAAQAPGALEYETLAGVGVHRLALRSLAPDDNFLWPLAETRFRSILASFRPDVVHFHNVMGLGAGLIPIAVAQGARVAVTLHDYWGFCFKNTMLRNDGVACAEVEDCGACMPTIAANDRGRLPMRVRRDFVSWSLDQAHVLISPSAWLAEAYDRSGLFRRKIVSVSNGIDLDAIPVSTKPSDGKTRFATFSYLGEHKGIKTLFEAVRLLGDDGDIRGKWELTICGDGHLRDWLSRSVADAGLTDHVLVAGHVGRAEAMSTMGRCDAMILASTWPENQPVSLLEAIASGTAQIATNIGGNPELVVDGESGRLVSPGDPRELADAMRALIVDPAHASHFGAFNAERRALFDERRSIERIEEILLQPAATPVDEPRDVVVICDGVSASNELALAVNKLHLATLGGPRIRLVWKDWATAETWLEASLFWVWDSARPLHETMANTALRAGVLSLLPTDLCVTKRCSMRSPRSPRSQVSAWKIDLVARRSADWRASLTPRPPVARSI